MHRKLNLLLRGGLLAALLGTAACSDAQPETPLAAAVATPAADFETEAIPSVNLRSMMDTITRGMIADSTDDYDRPSSTAVSRFRQAADSVMAGRVAGADAVLNGFGYDAYRIRESSTGDTLTVLRERLAANDTVPRGWGTYIYNPRAQQLVDIHVNHPISDLNTEDIGIELYRDGHYRWFMVAGAERDANPDSMEADVAHASTTIFHTMATRVAMYLVRVVSIHGFDVDNHDNLPDGADQVISHGINGDTIYGAALLNLRTRLVNAGWEAGLFERTPGFTSLGGTENVQGQHWNARVGRERWMHLEIEHNVRTSTTAWRAMNTTLRAWIAAHPWPWSAAGE
jgi:hypothetical protein